jgi:NAD(P)-dependent dehydrogenase (short-subunit alcohol dehydrogenase family)
MQELAGRTAVVTGAASGIGAGLARSFAAEGMNLVIADVEPLPAEKLAHELEAEGVRAVSLRTDVAREVDLFALAELAFREFGAVHVLCNNAGVCQGGPIHEMSAADWRWILSVNLEGVIHGCRAFAPRLVEQAGRGEPSHIVNTASVGGFLSGGGLGMYSTTKFAVVAYSEALAQDLAPHGIGVSVLAPGATATRLAEAARNRPTELGTAPARMESIEGAMAEGMDPREVGRHVIRGIREGALYVFTDPIYRSLLEARCAAVLAACEHAGDPLD